MPAPAIPPPGTAGWIDVAPLAAFGKGSYRLVERDGLGVVVFALDGELHAYENICPHDYCPLMAEQVDAPGRGRVEADEVYCPRHGARFDIRSGAVLTGPAFEGLPRLQLRVRHGRVQVRDQRF